MENITKVLEAIGQALADKDLQISCLQFNLESTKKALEEAEAKAAQLQAEVNDYLDNLPIRPEVSE